MNTERESETTPGFLANAVEKLKGRTVMLLGDTGTGKTKLACDLVERLIEQGDAAALVSADMGQPCVGVPTCMGLAMGSPWNRPAALWFVGDVTPRGNLLPTVVGASRLVRRAREKGAHSVVVDTTGLVQGPVGLALKYHKALASGVNCVVALPRSDELGGAIELLKGICPTVYRQPPAPGAFDRSAAERKASRESRLRDHFQGGAVRWVDRTQVIGADWAATSLGSHAPPPRTVVGLLDRDGFCLGLGLIEEVRPDRVALFTANDALGEFVRARTGRLRLDRRAGFAEVR
jgi:polynucleotide 5'-kinase involved in rRNA processing